MDSVRTFHLPEHESKLPMCEWLSKLLRTSEFLVRCVSKRTVRMRRKQNLRGSLRCMPKFSSRVVECILDYVGFVVSDNAEPIILASCPSQLIACRELCGRDALVVSCGWHPEQLSAAEYNGYICRNVSANLIGSPRHTSSPPVLMERAPGERNAGPPAAPAPELVSKIAE